MAAEAPKVSARALTLLVAVAALVAGLDQAAKALVVTHLTQGVPVHVIGTLLQFVYVRNAGAAFSIGSGTTWVFSVIAVAVLVFIVWYARRIRSTGWAVVFGLLLGGLVGNLADRLFRPPGFGVGHVVDFVRIPVLEAIFNLADVAITSSMVLFLVLVLRGVGLDGARSARTRDEDAAPAGDGREPAGPGRLAADDRAPGTPAGAPRVADDESGAGSRGADAP